MPEKTIIITGSSGYLGSKILSSCRRLNKRNVIGLDFKNADINLDLMDYKQLVDVKNNFGHSYILLSSLDFLKKHCF